MLSVSLFLSPCMSPLSFTGIIILMALVFMLGLTPPQCQRLPIEYIEVM